MIEKKNSTYAVVGLGNISDRHRTNLKSIFPSSQIACLSSSGRYLNHLPIACDILASSLDELILLSPSFAIIASPATFHAEHAIPFIENNIPVLIEKPIAASKEDARKIINSIKQYKTPVAIGYCLRYKPFLKEVQDLLDHERIGKILKVDITCGSYLPDWRPSKDYLDSVSASASLGGGVMLELSHELDYANFLLKKMHLESAVISNSGTLNIDVEDTADLIFKLSAGGTLAVHLDFLQKSAIRHAQFHGSEGKILWDLQNNNLDTSVSGHEKNRSVENWNSNEMYIQMIKDFANHFIENQQNDLCTPLEAFHVLEYIEQAKQLSNKDTNE